MINIILIITLCLLLFALGYFWMNERNDDET